MIMIFPTARNIEPHFLGCCGENNPSIEYEFLLHQRIFSEHNIENENIISSFKSIEVNIYSRARASVEGIKINRCRRRKPYNIEEQIMFLCLSISNIIIKLHNQM